VELDEILAYIAERSPQGARRVHLRLRSITSLLLKYPHSGQKTSIGRLRRIAAVPYPYLIFYEATEDEIVVIGVRHAARDPASMPGEEDS